MMAECEVKMECDLDSDSDLEEGEIPETKWKHSYVDQDQNPRNDVDYGATSMAHEGDRGVVRKEVRFEEGRANKMTYYDRDARPSRNGTDDNSSRPVLQYDDDLYEVVDDCESDKNLKDDKENQSRTKKDKLDDLSVEINVNLCSNADIRKVKVEHPNTNGSLKDHYRTSRSSSRSKEDITSKNTHKSSRIQDNKAMKRQHSPHMKHDEAPFTKKRSSYIPSSRKYHESKSSTSRAVSKSRPSSLKGHKMKSASDHYTKPKKSTKRIEGRSGKTYHSSHENVKRSAKSVSPILLEDGKRVDSPIRESRPPLGQEADSRSYSPISERSLSPCQGANDSSTSIEKNDTSVAIFRNESFVKNVPAFLKQLKRNTLTESTSDKRKRSLAVYIYKLLVLHLSNCTKKYLSSHELKDMLNKDPSIPVHFQPDELLMELIKRNDDLFVSLCIWNTMRIWPKTDVKICHIFTNNPSTTHPCNDLHICKYYMLSECKERTCKFGHELSNPHNGEVRKEFALEDFNDFQTRRLMQTNESRNMSTLPLICKFYNNEGGCSRPYCKHLHLCKYFVKGECKFDYRCKRTHTISEGQALDVLKKFYGLFPKCKDDDTIIQLLVKTLEGGNVKLKREITQGIPLATISHQQCNAIEETSNSPKANTVDEMFRSSATEGPYRSGTTKTSLDFIPLETRDENDQYEGSVGSEANLILHHGPDNIQQFDEIGNERTDDNNMETSDANDESTGSVGSEARVLQNGQDNVQQFDEIENERTDDNITETKVENESATLHASDKTVETIMLNRNGDINVLSSTEDSECLPKSERKPDDPSISSSVDDFKLDEVVTCTEKNSSNEINNEEDEKEVMQMDSINEEKSTENTLIQHRLEVNVEATVLESELCPDEPVVTKPHNAVVNVTPSNACILPAWTPLKPTSPKDFSYGTDVQGRDKCKDIQSSGSDCNTNDAVTCTEIEPISNDDHVANTKAAVEGPALVIGQIEITTSFPPDISARHEMPALSLKQSDQNYPNQDDYPHQKMGKCGNKCIANNGNGRENDSDDNNGNVFQYDASNDIEGEKESFANRGNIIHNGIDVNSGNENDKVCNAMSGTVSDNESTSNTSSEIGGGNCHDVNDDIRSENDKNTMSGNVIENETNENSGNGYDNKSNAYSPYRSDNEYIVNGGNGSENESNALRGNGIENDCKTTEINEATCNPGDDDWSIFEECSMEYKRNDVSYTIRFRNNSAKWQITSTSSGIWKDLNSLDETIMNNVAGICERYALEN